MDSADSRQLDAVVEGVLRTLGDSIVGVYHYGSAVLGGLRRFSDLDVLVVVDRPTTDDQRRQLLAEIMPVSGSRGARLAGRPIEVTIVLQETVKPWRPHQEREFQYGEWLRGDYETGEVPEPQPDHDDLAPLLATVLTASVALVGPPAGEVIDPAPHEGLVASMRRAVPSLVADLDTDTTNVLLTLARMWHTKDTGMIVSKDEAATWTLERLPRDLRPPLAHARAVYLGEEDTSFEHLPTPARSTAEHLVAIIGR
jgi:streptomycin 3"-adenylyltransferase